MLLEKWSKAINELIGKAKDVVSSITNHSLLLGDAREKFISSILESFLPKTIVVGSGIIVDHKGDYSKQIDIIIYRNDFPVFRTLGNADVYLLEGVIATIEVKSKLTKKAFKEALDNCKSVRNLFAKVHQGPLDAFARKEFNRNYMELDDLQKNFLFEQTLPATYIYGYMGFQRVSTLRGHLSKSNISLLHLPSIICAEKTVGVKNLKRKYIIPSSSNIIAYVGKIHDSPISYLLEDLIHRVIHVNGTPTLFGTGVTYDISEYTNIDENNGHDWEALVNITVI